MGKEGFREASSGSIACSLIIFGVFLCLFGVLPRSASALFTEDVRTEGEIPVDLNGVWLMVSTLDFPNGQHTTLPHIYRITHVPRKIAEAIRPTPRPTPEATEEEGKILIPKVPKRRILGDDIDVMFYDVEYPEPLSSTLARLQNEKKPWKPSKEDLKMLGEKWSTLKEKNPSEYSRIEYRIVAAENFDNSLQLDDATKGAKLAIIANQTVIPGPKSTGGNIVFVWGVRKVEPGKLSGTFVRSHLSGAPFPIAVTTNGKFEMYKIAEVPRDWEKKAALLEKKATPAPAATPAPGASPAPAGEAK